MPARYIVGVDGSGPSEAALAWAADHAERAGAPLVLVHVESEEREPDPYRAQVTPRPEFGADVVRLAPPVPSALARFVRDDDLLVIGTGKAGFIHGRVYGALGIQIASAVRSGIAVIPEVDLRFRSGVVAGIDRDETASAVSAAAATEAAARNEPLHLVQSVRSADWRLPSAPDHAIERAESTVRKGWPELVVRVRVTARPAPEALLDVARDAALLVLGPGGPVGTSSLGHVLHDILVNANAPVLIVR